MKPSIVGGPLTDLVPLVVTINTSAATPKRWILLPNSSLSSSSLTILHPGTGIRVAELVIRGDATNTQICCVSSSFETLWVGCNNGTVQQFDLSNLTFLQSGNFPNNDTLEFNPVAQYRLASHKVSIEQLAVVCEPTTGNMKNVNRDDSKSCSGNGNILYALLRQQKWKKGYQTITLGRVVLSHLSNFVDKNSIDVSAQVDTVDTFTLSQEHPEEKLPFFVQTIPAHNNDGVVCVLASPTTLRVFYDPFINSTSSNPILENNTKSAEKSKLPIKITAAAKHRIRRLHLDRTYGSSLNSPLTTCRIHGNDLVVGDRDGVVRILHNALPIAVNYCRNTDDNDYTPKPMDHKRNHTHFASLLVRPLHWHAHPVVTMSVHDDLLYTGGDESVLVTWQLARDGTSKPAHVWPRLALAGIRHLVLVPPQSSTDNAALLIYSDDNLLQLVDMVHKKIIWKVQGLATSKRDSSDDNVSDLNMVATIDNSTILLSGLPLAPGYLHWYNTDQRRVIQQLSIAPYNRVSRTERGGRPLPAPRVTHARVAAHSLVTVDVIPTENASVGAPVSCNDGSVTTIRFWHRFEQQSYEQVAAMAHPHGSRYRVTALALSDCGKYAVTLSNDEGVFRLWQQTRPYTKNVISSPKASMPREEDDNPFWICRCKVTFPSGYSNYHAGHDAMAFSSDSSVLAIAFGQHLTMWDHSQVTLLNGMHPGEDETAIEYVHFLNSDHLVDMLMTKSSTCVAVESPYGSRGPAGWKWVVPPEERSFSISKAVFLTDVDLIAIAIYNPIDDHSRLFLVDAHSGAVCQSLRGDASPVVDNVLGEITALSGSGQVRSNLSRQRSRANSETGKSSVVSLYAATSYADMTYLTNRERKKIGSISRGPGVDTSTEVPTLPLLTSKTNESTTKRKVDVLQLSDLEGPPSTRRFPDPLIGILDSAGSTLATMPTSDLPLLRGAFARAFVGRHLKRQ